MFWVCGDSAPAFLGTSALVNLKSYLDNSTFGLAPSVSRGVGSKCVMSSVSLNQ